MTPELKDIINKIENGEITTFCIYELMDKYYQSQYMCSNEDDDESYEPLPFPEELLQPVEQRKSGIGIALSRLISAGHSVSEPDDDFNALMLTVAEADAPMVHYLIAHGADFSTWPDMDEDLKYGEGNYFLEDIDIHFMHESYANDKNLEYMKALHRTAIVLAKEAGLGPFSGYCLKIDEKGNVTMSDVKVLF